MKNQTRRDTLRRIMVLAWDFYRTDLRSSHPRSFADALAGAWRWVKRTAERAAADVAWVRKVKARGGRMSPSLIRSPIQRSLSGSRYAGTADHQAAYTTARMGF
jgi:hypothetical protein